jgi:hypothetical protein
MSTNRVYSEKKNQARNYYEQQPQQLRPHPRSLRHQ